MKFKRDQGKAWWGALASVAALSIAIPLVFAQGGGTQTAQSIMVAVKPNASAYQIVGTITWSFNNQPPHDCVVEGGYYTTIITGPDITCSGQGCTNPPPTPDPPSPDPSNTRFVANQERCVFFCGGTLTAPESSQNPYTQFVNVNIPSGPNRGNWKFTWTYTIVPTGNGEVAARTCWDDEVTGGTVVVGYGGFVSSESYAKRKNQPDKYSFTLLDDQGGSRVTDVVVKLQKFVDPNWVDVEILPLGLLPVSPTALNYTYSGNGGIFGNSAVYDKLHAAEFSPPAQGALNVNAILLSDGFLNNDGDLGAGRVHQANVGPGSFSPLGIGDEGTYRIFTSGILKGNSGSAPSVSFGVSSSVFEFGGCTCSP
jgi:hypothetical protein